MKIRSCAWWFKGKIDGVGLRGIAHDELLYICLGAIDEGAGA